ncbi:MAG TPA: S8 family peptidase [Kofleriaceae bacterium]|nr:S8 family peptidase [Kofleriaceae bacterium]
MLRNLVPGLVLGCSLLTACALDDSTAESADTLTGHPGRYIVVFKSDRVPADAAARVAKAGGTANRTLSDVGVMTATGDAAFAAKLAKDTAVLAVGPEQLYNVPDVTSMEVADDELGTVEGAPTAADNLYFYQWDMRRMEVPSVWARMPLSSTQPRVAVLDTGFMHDHPDLVGQACELRSFTYCNSSGGVPSSPAYPKYSTLIDFDQFPTWNPSDGCTAATTKYEAHGTHTSGTVAAKLGGGRVVGVAPDACVGAYKVFDRYRYTDPVDGVVDAVGAFDGPIFDAIVTATNSGYPVISMSLGSTQFMGPDGNASWLAWNRVANYANRKGTLIVGSAGNSALDLNGPIVHVPSDLPTVLSVGATGTNNLPRVGGLFVAQPGSDVLAFYSNYGSANDVSAPGGDCGPGYPNSCVAQHLILSTTINAVTGAVQYAFFAGTSMATPHVAAVAAQVKLLHPELTPGQLRSWIKDHAEDLGNRQLFGQGMVNAALAVQ